MSAPVEPADLVDLKLVPAWVKEPGTTKQYDHYATEFGDHGAVDTYIAENSRSGKPALAAAMKLQRKRIAGGFGSADIAAHLGGSGVPRADRPRRSGMAPC